MSARQAFIAGISILIVLLGLFALLYYFEVIRFSCVCNCQSEGCKNCAAPAPVTCQWYTVSNKWPLGGGAVISRNKVIEGQETIDTLEKAKAFAMAQFGATSENCKHVVVVWNNVRDEGNFYYGEAIPLSSTGSEWDTYVFGSTEPTF